MIIKTNSLKRILLSHTNFYDWEALIEDEVGIFNLYSIYRQPFVSKWKEGKTWINGSRVPKQFIFKVFHSLDPHHTLETYSFYDLPKLFGKKEIVVGKPQFGVRGYGILIGSPKDMFLFFKNIEKSPDRFVEIPESIKALNFNSRSKGMIYSHLLSLEYFFQEFAVHEFEIRFYVSPVFKSVFEYCLLKKTDLTTFERHYEVVKTEDYPELEKYVKDISLKFQVRSNIFWPFMSMDIIVNSNSFWIIDCGIEFSFAELIAKGPLGIESKFRKWISEHYDVESELLKLLK